MTYRHHYAELESQTNHSAIYKFTPDSIEMKHWGRVEFSLLDHSIKVHEYAKEPKDDFKWQDNVCRALLRKFKTHIDNNDGKIPRKLEFVA